jgi:hypothetical protein
MKPFFAICFGLPAIEFWSPIGSGFALTGDYDWSFYQCETIQSKRGVK